MKKLIISAVSLGLAISSSFAQGSFNFDNSAAYTGAANEFTITIGFGRAGEGTPGQVAGSDSTFATPNYDVSFLYQLGTANSGAPLFPEQFIAGGATNGLIQGGFFAHTGDAVDAGGLYGLGTATIPGTTDGSLITVQVISWYDPTGTTSFLNAVAEGYNNGGGPLTTVRLVAGTDNNVANMSTVPGFVMGMPEPSTFALSCIGLGALMLARRRKMVKTSA